MANLKVFMVGGRRSGKTSILASMFDQITNGPVNRIITLADGTRYQRVINSKGETEDQDQLHAKKYELTYLLEKRKNTELFLIDESPTYELWTYSLDFTLPVKGGASKKMTIDFHDCPGEYFEGGKFDKETGAPVDQVLIDLIEQSAVIVVAVDTPFLMGFEEKQCCKTVSSAVNTSLSIHNFLTHIDTRSAGGKMVIFVPVKCEKWVKEGRLNDVVDRIKEEYSTTIRFLQQRSTVNPTNVCIMPIETVGNIVFAEMRDAKTITSQGKTEKCCTLSESLVRLKDGKPKSVKDGDIVNDDMEAIANGLPRPGTWFRINPNPKDANNLYEPKNCEQLPLHILEFWLKKYQKEEARGGFWGKICKFVFGGLTVDDLQGIISKLNSSNLIKNNIDGIEYIHKDY